MDFVLEAKNKVAFTKDELADSKIMITITLFDEHTITEHFGNRTTTYHENIYLGQIDIPLTSLLTQTKLEGYIQV